MLLCTAVQIIEPSVNHPLRCQSFNVLQSFNKVQITQRSSNHSTKYKPFNVLYKSFSIVQIIRRSTLSFNFVQIVQILII